MRDAVIAALNLNIFMRHADRVRGANIAQMANVLQAMILTDGPNMVLTPTYHVYEMYVPFQGATLIPSQFDTGTFAFGDISVPGADAVAARDADGKLWLSLVNVDPTRPVTLTMQVTGDHQTATGHILRRRRWTATTVSTSRTPCLIIDGTFAYGSKSRRKVRARRYCMRRSEMLSVVDPRDHSLRHRVAISPP